MAKGIDRADKFDTQAELDWLKCLKDTQGVTFVGRYYKPSPTHSYSLTKTEAQAISALGLNIVTVYQGSGTSASSFSYTKGQTDCENAISRAEVIGQPANTAIYFAVDFDAYNTAGAMDAIREHFRGINTTMLNYENLNGSKWAIGVYGGRQVVEDIKSLGRATYMWQATGWRYGADAAYHLKQTEIEVTVACGGRSYILDWDDSNATATYGGFRI